MPEPFDPKLLDICAAEPIRIPGSIQPHGALVALAVETGCVTHASANARDILGVEPGDVLGRPLPPESPLGQAVAALIDRDGDPDTSEEVIVGGRPWHVTLHRGAETIIVEAERPAGHERVEALYARVRQLVEELQAETTIDAITASTARIVRAITGFDRVLAYRFDETWNGSVIAEDRNEVLPSYMGLRFPASDIPAQARELYVVSRLRQIPDVDYTPVPLLASPDAAARGPLDLGQAALRSVSPVHLQYMRNMGTAASMSISIVVAGRLWGLISCHNREPLWTPPAVRGACDVIGQVLAMRLAGHQLHANAADRVLRQAIHARLLTAMAAAPRFLEGLTDDADDLLALTGAAGAAIVSDESCVCVGRTPPEPDIRSIVRWLEGQPQDDVLATDALPKLLPELEHARDTAAGLVAVSISQIHPSYVLWFRPEVVGTVNWAGDPRKPAADDGGGPNPRRSFATWKEQVHLTAAPWSAGEIEAARDLRSAIINIVLLKAEQLADLSRELERSNKELEAFSYSVSHDLRAPFRHIVGYAELLRERGGEAFDEKGRHYLENIIQSAFSAGRLVDDLLSFSQMGRVTLHLRPVSLERLVDEVLRLLATEIEARPVVFKRSPLPEVEGDPALLRQVFQNLIENALKYTRGRDPAVIEIGAQRHDDTVVVRVSDNGVGFDMAYVGKLFGVFQRLHRAEEFEGTGIGLATVRRIVERHGGLAWAEGALGAGATFYVSLPDPGPAARS